jgi:hypothetical protein
MSELYRSSDCSLSANLVLTFAGRGCHEVSAMDPHDPILGFLDLSHYLFFQVAPQLYSRGWVDPIPDTLLPRKYGSAGNWTRTSGSAARNSDHTQCPTYKWMCSPCAEVCADSALPVAECSTHSSASSGHIPTHPGTGRPSAQFPVAVLYGPHSGPWK